MLLICFLGGIGCLAIGEDGPDYWTKFRLRKLGSACANLTVQDVQAISSLRDLLDAAVSKGRLQGKAADFETDGWNKQMRYVIANDDRCTKLQIVSSGPNGIFEQGRGDDLFVEIKYWDGKQAIISQSWPEPKGETVKK
jgi:hypothetical protein